MIKGIWGVIGGGVFLLVVTFWGYWFNTFLAFILTILVSLLFFLILGVIINKVIGKVIRIK